MKNLLAKFILGSVLAALLTGCATPRIQSIRDEATATPQPPVLSNFITISSSGFTPENISINAGETVIFQNNDSKPHEIASDPHPDDNILPDLRSGVLYKDETYQYAFQKSGSFGFHLEDNPSVKGKVVVE